jgi:DNA polymerase-3 subunit delta
MMLISSEFEKLLLYVGTPATPSGVVILTLSEQSESKGKNPRISPEEPKHSTDNTQNETVISTEGGALAAAVEKSASLPIQPVPPITKNRVTLGDVETMVLAAKQRSLYELTDAISSKDRPRALLLLHGLLNASDGGEDAAIGHLYMLARTFRQMLIISEKNVRDPRAIWQVLWQGFRMPPFAAEDLIKQARRYKSRRELTRAIRLVARADLELRSSPANKLLVLERLILDLSTEPKPTTYEPSHQFAMEL